MSIAIPVRFASSIELRRVCPNCGFIRPHLLSNLSSREHIRLNDLVEHRSFIKRRAHVHRSGSAFKWLYFVHSGFLKTAVMDDHGRQQTVGFKMAGDPVGLEAIEAARRLAPDLIVMDLCMPGMTGLEAARKIREEFPAMLIMLMTTPDADLEEAARSAGIRGTVSKMAMDKMVSGVHALLRGEEFHELSER